MNKPDRYTATASGEVVDFCANPGFERVCKCRDADTAQRVAEALNFREAAISTVRRNSDMEPLRIRALTLDPAAA